MPVSKQYLPKVPALGLEQLPPHLQRYLVVRLLPHQLHQTLLLLQGQVLLVSLHEREQALVPEHGKRTRIGDKTHEVRVQCVNHVVGQGVLLVQERAEEDAVGSAVVHLGYLEDSCAGVQHRDAGLGQGAADDEGLAEGAGPALAQG